MFIVKNLKKKPPNSGRSDMLIHHLKTFPALKLAIANLQLYLFRNYSVTTTIMHPLTRLCFSRNIVDALLL